MTATRPASQDFSGKAVLVTGAGSGIGRAAAEIFAARGGAVAVVDINSDSARETVARIEQAGGRAIAIAADVTCEDAVAKMVERTVNELGGLHCAFNNAGFGGELTPFVDYALDEWNRIISVSLTSAFLCMRSEIAHMLENGGGAIVNTASAAGVMGVPQMPAYTAAKHGVVGITKVAAIEFGGRGVRVNAVCPGSIDTPMMRELIGGDPQVEKYMTASTPFGRFGRPEEIAEAAVWLCSDAASLVSGLSMIVDGATLAR